MSSFVLGFRDIDKTKREIVGGKGANLGELSRIDGIIVPEGFCITIEAYKQMIGQAPEFYNLLEQLSLLKGEDREKIGEISKKIRSVIEEMVIAKDVAEAITHFLTKSGEHYTYAIRSSATAEDLPTASFAGQQDTYLNIRGKESILKHISKCWASLFTDRAVIYRIQNGFDHKNVHIAVIIQKMVNAEVAGIMFTADPVTSNRKQLSIDAIFGLGEALVSGLVSPDSYKVQEEAIIEKRIATKTVAISERKADGTEIQQLAPDQQKAQTLTEQQILQLARIGRRIEAHFGCPQDIEWCLVGNIFSIVQSRPITTLYPIPEGYDQENHVYVSVSHQQMMTDPMKPLGITLFQLTAGRPMFKAGGRLFVDVTSLLASPASREKILDVLGKGDPLIRDALVSVIERGNFIPSAADDKQAKIPGNSNQGPSLPNFQTLNEYDPAIVSDLIKRSEVAIEELKQTIQMKSGLDLLDFIVEDIQQLKKSLSNPQGFGMIMTAMNASLWVNENMQEWLGEKNVADTLSQSVPNNITSEMGLALLDVADVIRRYPAVINYLQQVKNDTFLDELLPLEGGQESRAAFSVYLNKYGMRCAGEIDITRSRWSEKPATLIPLLLGHVKNFEAGESKRRFERGRQEALQKEQELVDRLQQLPDGEQKARETRRMIGFIRNFIGYREYPKYEMIHRYLIYKQALLKEAEQLVQAGVLYKKEDIYYLTFQELREVVRTQMLDEQNMSNRADEYKFYQTLTPPRVITSDGEIITGEYRRKNLPASAVIGLPVSSGVIEGRARVIFTMEDASLEEGDILVTSFTDPSWTPLFISIKGLITEVGGLMTHGAVIAREYGLPAVVNVKNATRLIKDGQRIRVNGTEGYVEIL